MMNHKKFYLITATYLGCALMLNSCCGTFSKKAQPEVIGVVEYSAGELRVIEPSNYEDVWDAALAAVQALDMNIIHTEKDTLEGSMLIRRSDDSKVTITLRRGYQNTSHLSIKVGVFGDEAVAKAIYSEIKRRITPVLARPPKEDLNRSRATNTH